MHKIKNALLALLALTSVLSAFFLIPPKTAEAAAFCYVELGPFRVEPNTITCPAPSASVSYVDINGQPATNYSQGTRCYVSRRADEFSTVLTYREYRCVDLETLRNNAFRESCEGSGGDFSIEPAPSLPGGGQITPTGQIGRCTCPDGNILGSGQRCRDAGADTDADLSEPAFTKNDCNNDSNGDGSNIDQSDCGITRYIVIAINLLSALVAVVVIGSIIAGGIQYTTAGSDPQKISAAKNRIKWAIIALFIFIFGYSFLNFLIPGGVL